MAFIIPWNETLPDGDVTPVADLDTELQNLKKSVRERMNQITSGAWETDAVDPKRIKAAAGLLSARPASPASDGELFYATDTNALFIGDTGIWIVFGKGPSWETQVVLSTDTATGANTAETDLKTFTLPANQMGVGGGVRIVIGGTVGGTADIKTIRVYFGGTIVLTQTLAATENGDFRIDVQVFNRGAVNSQMATAVILTPVAGKEVKVSTSFFAVDTALSQILKVTGQTPNAADEITVSLFTVDSKRVG